MVYREYWISLLMRIEELHTYFTKISAKISLDFIHFVSESYKAEIIISYFSLKKNMAALAPLLFNLFLKVSFIEYHCKIFSFIFFIKKKILSDLKCSKIFKTRKGKGNLFSSE